MLATEFFDSPTNSFPVESKQLAFEIENCHTEIVINEFSDKLFVVITQLNKIGSMMLVTAENNRISNNNLINVQPLLGASDNQLYQTFASCILQEILKIRPNEKRPLLLSLAFNKKMFIGDSIDTSMFIPNLLPEVLKVIKAIL
ncbi:hypothetical protein H8356DRAFT_972403 [Neocallimastix lanati (nom. inval.)]|uniref:Uncharacterized protein n=1 Tax=Neocallimastix californiae TaxID=1754190 RepID=A0A1Y2B6W7_9FUNG|nr:hypothetical protein H8356DRAFT_972403 [Neocallimastix sp. JGI-2020a]ORY30426.1 hypothetical protein LY90DRAFT_673816 [Neocallimastix californiae]|eukprot:ORY30426.1 hypothetical protein LY90DRAFT_673816 [Neocallimastix californiae]